MKRTVFVGDCISVLGKLDIQSTRLEYSSYLRFLSVTFEGPRTRVVYQKVKHGKLPNYCKNEEKCW